MTRDKLIPVLPTNYRNIALYAISVAQEPVVLMDLRRTTDFSKSGQLTQKGIRTCINYEIRDGSKAIFRFHDYPDEMWVAETFSSVAAFCAEQGWLKIEGEAS